ncbi:MAG: DUF4395 family protein, partial [Terracoccus sp.]
KRTYALPLRFTPVVGTAAIIIGLILHSPLWLGTMALITLSGALLPRGMFIDVIYNLGVRHLFRAAALPSTPTPRRYSYLLSTILLTGSALSFQHGVPAAGYVLGGAVAIGGATLAVSLWCVGSWAYNTVLRATPEAGPTPIEALRRARVRRAQVRRACTKEVIRSVAHVQNGPTGVHHKQHGSGW